MAPSRTRQRGYQTFSTTSSYQDSCPGSPASTPTSSSGEVYADRRETISDTLRGRSSSDRNFVGTVGHTKYLGSHQGFTQATWYTGSQCPGNAGKRYRKVTFSSPWYPTLSFPNIGNPQGWQSSGAWCDRALRSLCEAVPAQTSLPNFLLELGEIRSLLPQIKALLRNASASLREGNFKDVLKQAANGHLTLEFGIKPFLSDIESIVYAHERAVRRLNWLRKNNQKRVTVRKRRVGSVEVSESQYPAGFPGLSTQVHVKRSAISAVVTEVCGAQAYLSYSGLDAPLAEIRSIRNYFGFHKPFSVIWEAIPFSWLIDYFAHIDELIDRLPTTSEFQGTTRLSHAWFSKKIEYRVIFTLGSSLSDFSLTGNHAYVGSFTSYSRSPVVPSSYNPPLLSGDLSGSQITNLLALLAQKGL